MLREELEEFLREEGPSAIVVREELEPVEGKSSVFFPPTFAPEREEKRPTGTPIGEFGIEKGSNWVLVDTVESQANRIEPIFKTEKYKDLVPQIELKVGELKINLLDLGHRITDATVRFSDLQPEIEKALEEFGRKGNAGPLATLAPTSLLFGFWDSRGTGVKWPRLLRSEIRAWKVTKLERGFQYTPAVFKEMKPEKEWKVYIKIDPEMKRLYEEEFKKDEKSFKEALGKVGLGSVSDRLVGGCVLLEGGSIVRDACLQLVGLRDLVVLDPDGKINEQKTKLLKEYILILGLVALTFPQNYNLRQGCLLTRVKGEMEKVHRDGRREPIELKHEEVLELARKIALEFKETFKIREPREPIPVSLTRMMDEVKKLKEKEERKKEKAEE